MITQLCQLNLQLSLFRTCPLCKDIEDQCCAVNDLASQSQCEVPLLRRRKFIIKMTIVAPVCCIARESSSTLPRPRKKAASGFPLRWMHIPMTAAPAVSARRCSSAMLSSMESTAAWLSISTPAKRAVSFLVQSQNLWDE